jgi:hypothetical protein
MPCYHPIIGYRAKRLNANGKRPIVFNKNEGYQDMEETLPCGQCIGCKLERSRQWAIRCLHESKCYTENCFLTLTYDDEHLPKNNSLTKTDIQLFIKRLRKKYSQKVIRYFQCGEYGELLNRPHHHICLFNHAFSDAVSLEDTDCGDTTSPLFSSESPTRSGARSYLSTSKTVSSLWKYGYHTIGDLNWETAAYTARYIMKKISGDNAAEHYGNRLPEYTTMSRNPGIGKPYFDKYHTDFYSIDKVIVNKNLTIHPPRYYDYLYDKTPTGKKLLPSIKRRRKKCINQADTTHDRLETKEAIHSQKITTLTRKLERKNENKDVLRKGQQNGHLWSHFLQSIRSECIQRARRSDAKQELATIPVSGRLRPLLHGLI